MLPLSPEVRVLASFGALLLFCLFPDAARQCADTASRNRVFVLVLSLLWMVGLALTAAVPHTPRLDPYQRMALGLCLLLSYASTWFRRPQWRLWLLRMAGLVVLASQSLRLLQAAEIALCIPPLLLMALDFRATSWASRMLLLAAAATASPLFVGLAAADHFGMRPDEWRGAAWWAATVVCAGAVLAPWLSIAGMAGFSVILVRRNLGGNPGNPRDGVDELSIR